MKSLLFALRLVALGLVFFLLGCGGGEQETDHGSDPLYKLRFSWENGSGSTVHFTGTDLVTNASEGINVSPDVTDGTIVTSFYTTNTTNIVAIVSDDAGREIARVNANGVHIAENKTTYITASYDGTTLRLSAGGQPGEP
ncbi:MAG: hypothetical protein QM758_05215 [Armatimonas sp.]